MTPAPVRPCGQGSDTAGKDKGNANAIVVFLPLALGGIIATGRGRLVRSARAIGSRRMRRHPASRDTAES